MTFDEFQAINKRKNTLTQELSRYTKNVCKQNNNCYKCKYYSNKYNKCRIQLITKELKETINIMSENIKEVVTNE